MTKADLDAVNIQSATERMNTGDGGLAKHASTCPHEVDWVNAKIIGRERRWTQRKYLEGIESLRQKNKGKLHLNTFMGKIKLTQPTI